MPHTDDHRVTADRLRRLASEVSADLFLVTRQAHDLVGGPAETELTDRLIGCHRLAAEAVNALERIAAELELRAWSDPGAS